MTITADSPYPSDGPHAVKVVKVDGEPDTLAIEFRGDVQDVLDAVVNALVCYGVRGQYESLAEAVQALGRRAEAAEAATEEADTDEVLTEIVESLTRLGMPVGPDVIAIAAVRVWRDLGRRYRHVPAG